MIARVKGKTGSRDVVLFKSVPYVQKWLQAHPSKEKNAPLWIIEDIKKSLKKEPGGVRLVGFGTFKKATRKPRVGRNPQTGESIKIAKKTYAKFVPSKTWKLV